MNKQIIDIFKELADIYSILGDEFRALAYSKAIASIRRYGKPIVDAQIIKLPNIGASIALKMNEIINTGQLKLLDDLRNDPHIKLFKEMSRIQGFSRQYVLNLLKTLNITSLDDIKKLYQAGKLKLTDTQKKGLEYSTDLLQRIPREEIKKVSEIIKREAKKLDPDIHVETVGSYRRGKTSSKDIDLLIMKPRAKKLNGFLKDFVDHLKKAGIIEVTFSSGKRKFNGMVKTKYSPYARSIDLMYIIPPEYPTALVSYTGSNVFNIRQRGIAKDLKMKLSDQGLFKNGKRVSLKTEKDLFKALKMPYLEPHQRDV